MCGRELDVVDLKRVRTRSVTKEFAEEQKKDKTLLQCRSLAESWDKVFSWENDLLFKIVMDDIRGELELIVAPQTKRKELSNLAHEKSGHPGSKKVLAMVTKWFHWPFMVRNIICHCKSCGLCARCNKAGQKRAPLQVRQILTEPIEVMACDIVGPFVKGRGGYRYVLTSVCLATRWPTAIPLKNIRAGAVAQGLMENFAQTSIPLQLLTDRGSQFTGKLFSQVVKILNIKHLKTTAYHPQCNGAVERLNGTLKQGLTQYIASGTTWVDALPLLIYHL